MKSSQANVVGLVNQRLVSTLAKNLANMEHFTRRDAVSFILKGIVSNFSSGCCINRDVFYCPAGETSSGSGRAAGL